MQSTPSAASELLARSHLVVAHNASFDRSFVEAVVPVGQRGRLGVLPARGGLGPGRVSLEVPRVPPVRVRGIRAGPPPRARRLRGRRVAPHPNPARHRAHRLRRAPRDRGEAGSSDLGYAGLPFDYEGPAPTRAGTAGCRRSATGSRARGGRTSPAPDARGRVRLARRRLPRARPSSSAPTASRGATSPTRDRWRADPLRAESVAVHDIGETASRGATRHAHHRRAARRRSSPHGHFLFC